MAAALTHRNRAESSTQALREALGEVENDETVSAGFVDRYLEGESSVEGLTGFDGA